MEKLNDKSNGIKNGLFYRQASFITWQMPSHRSNRRGHVYMGLDLCYFIFSLIISTWRFIWMLKVFKFNGFETSKEIEGVQRKTDFPESNTR